MGTEDTSPSSSAVLIKPNLPLLYSKYIAIQGYENGTENMVWTRDLQTDWPAQLTTALLHYFTGTHAILASVLYFSSINLFHHRRDPKLVGIVPKIDFIAEQIHFPYIPNNVGAVHKPYSFRILRKRSKTYFKGWESINIFSRQQEAMNHC